MKAHKDMNFKQLLKNVKAFVFDIDGVLSKSILGITNNGDLLRTTNVKDGFILKYALSKGFKICIITGGLNEGVKKRYDALGVHGFFLGSNDKVRDFNKFIAAYNILPEEILYMGDDIPDYSVMNMVGIPTCPNDAVTEIKNISVYVSGYNGGEGCVRDIVEQVLRAQGKWEK